MDIIPVFGTVVGGSNPSESTSFLEKVGEVDILYMFFRNNAGMV
jgi:hypothetical protein